MKHQKQKAAPVGDDPAIVLPEAGFGTVANTSTRAAQSNTLDSNASDSRTQESAAQLSQKYGAAMKTKTFPKAFGPYRAKKRWVIWRKVWDDRLKKWKKVPLSVRTGRNGSSTDPATWGTYGQAIESFHKFKATGLGFVFTDDDDLYGIDLDKCSESGIPEYKRAMEALTHRETYAEWSQSGEGVHIFARGKIDKALKVDELGIEIYPSGRFFVVTFNQVASSPDLFAEAPLALEGLTSAAARYKEKQSAAKQAEREVLANKGKATPSFFTNVNAEAMAQVMRWAPFIFPKGAQSSNGAFRVSSAELGRGLEEDLSLHPTEGFYDFGEGKPFSPLDVVMTWGGAPDAPAAANWLCEKLGVSPVSLGWGKRQDAPAAKAPDEWKDLQELPHSLEPVLPFDFDMLPTQVVDWVRDVSMRMQCPPDFAGVVVMVALATVLGRKVALYPKQKDSWCVIPNMWGLLIGKPGVMKSPTQNAMLGPLKQLAQVARDEYEKEKVKYELECEEAKMRYEAHKAAYREDLKAKKNPGQLQPMEQIKEPTLKRYYTTNASVEALAELLCQNQNGLLVDRDELLSLLDRLDEEGRSDERGFFLQAWNGSGAYSIDRIGRGFDRTVPATCVSMIGGTQPARFSQYMKKICTGFTHNDGMVQRFSLMVWPDISKDWKNVDKKPNEAAFKKAVALFEKLDKLDLKSDSSGTTQNAAPTGSDEAIPFLRLTKEAHELFLPWLTAIEKEVRGEDLDPMLEGHISKYRKLIPALALICHLASGGEGDISKEAMTQALKWYAYLRSHAERAYGSGSVAAADAARAIIEKIHEGKLVDGFSPREIIRAKWSRLRDADTIHAALRLLCDHEWLEMEEGQRGKKTCFISPKIHPKVAGCLTDRTDRSSPRHPTCQSCQLGG